jgi:hypothetical protein
MPPSGPPSAATQAVLAQWVAAGMPSEQCDEPVADPFDVDPVCSTAYSWPEGNEGDEQMNPGMACITCHTQMSAEEETPDLIAAGTVFHKAHEPDKCYGVFYEGKPAGFEDVEIHVEITSTQSGVTERLRVDEESGNFHLRRSAAPERFDPPFTVKVLYDGRERAMPVPITADDLVHGAMDCNSCHTQDGKNGAPGRVVLP